MDTQTIQTHLIRINAMHGSPLILPTYQEESFQHLAGKVNFRHYIVDLIKANNNQFISRPVVEELWALTCRVLINVAFPETVGVGVSIGEKETALFAAFTQMNGVGQWDANVWWAQMADAARRQGYSLNITSQFDHNRAFTPEGSVSHKAFTSTDADEQMRLLTTPLIKLDEQDMNVAAANLDLDANNDTEMVEDMPKAVETVARKYVTRTIDEDYSEFDIE